MPKEKSFRADDLVLIDLREGWWLGKVTSVEGPIPPWPEPTISVKIHKDYTHNHQGAGESVGTVQKVSSGSPALHKLPSPNLENFG
ncbi:hypothetical protein HYW40_02245 [Candidatus Curtissbacteria bacterium]|nr:hypothetical protein [Candidatus Curtissbacteria bacterium]